MPAIKCLVVPASLIFCLNACWYDAKNKESAHQKKTFNAFVESKSANVLSCDESTPIENPESLDPSSIEACYRVTFSATWTEEDFPNVPGSAHFTTIVGAVVNDQSTLWKREGLASDGVELLAEIGGTASFLTEIETAIANNEAAYSFTSSGTDAVDSSTFTIQVFRTYPLTTWASMIAPSPDWFVGQAKFSLLDENGEWIKSETTKLNAYDAGTEEGTTFSLSGRGLSNHDPISRLNELVEGHLNFIEGNVEGKTLAEIRYERIQ